MIVVLCWSDAVDFETFDENNSEDNKFLITWLLINIQHLYEKFNDLFYIIVDIIHTCKRPIIWWKVWNFKALMEEIHAHFDFINGAAKKAQGNNYSNCNSMKFLDFKYEKLQNWLKTINALKMWQTTSNQIHYQIKIHSAIFQP